MQACTVKWYEILKIKNALAAPVYYVMEYILQIFISKVSPLTFDVSHIQLNEGI